MIKSDQPTSKGLRVVLIPVVVGSLLGLFASLSTTAYTTWATQRETIRKERLSHMEQAMTLCSKYSNDLARAIGVGLLTKGNADAKSLDALTSPTKTLLELKVVVALYLPALRNRHARPFVTSVASGAVVLRQLSDLAIAAGRKEPFAAEARPPLVE